MNNTNEIKKIFLNGNTEEAYGLYKSNSKIDEIIIDVEKKLGDYVYGDYIQKDPCIDGKYDIVYENNGGDDGDCGCCEWGCGLCCCCICCIGIESGNVCGCGCKIIERIFNCCCC